MDYCYICGKPLSDDGLGGCVKRHKEHIIHNGINGKLKSSTILCEKCGGKYSKSDAKFVELFDGFMVLLKKALYRKDHGKEKDKRIKAFLITEDGDRTAVEYCAGKTYPTIPNCKVDDEEKKIEIYGEKQRILQYKNLLLKKHPEYGDYSIELLDDMTGDCKIGLFFSEGNPEFNGIFKDGIVKIATEFAIDSGIDRNEIITSLSVQEDGSCVFDSSQTPMIPYSLHTTVDMLYTLVEDIVSINYPYHKLRLYVDSNKNSRMLVCYVDLFGVFKYYVILNPRYTGEEINCDYAQRLLEMKDSNGNNLSSSFDLVQSLTDECARLICLVQNYLNFRKLPPYVYDEMAFRKMLDNLITEEGINQVINDIRDYFDINHYVKHTIYHYDDQEPSVLSTLALSMKSVISNQEMVRIYATQRFNLLNRYCWNLDILTKNK